MHDKPHKFGLNIWCLCSSHFRFVLSIEVYEGTNTSLGKHGLGYHVTLCLLERYEDLGYTVVVKTSCIRLALSRFDQAKPSRFAS
jgi:hypothetical protein